MTRLRTALAVAATLLVAAPLMAPSTQAQGRGDDAFQIRLGGFFPSGDSDFWDDNENRFTLDADDFNSAIVGFTYVHSITNHLEFGVNLDVFEETTLSAERDFVDEFGSDILHDTTLSTVPIVVDLRVVPGGRFKLRGPRRVLKPVFYFGAGFGVNFYEYEEIGDFVDDSIPEDPVVFSGVFEARGVAPVAHGLVGLEFPVGGIISIIAEGRYVWSETEIDDDFDGLGDIDLGGAAAYVGASFRW